MTLGYACSTWQPGDLEQIQWLESLFSPSYTWTPKDVEKYCRSSLHLISRNSQGQPVAFVIALEQPDRVEILTLATNPTVQGQGVMRSLLDEFQRRFAKRKSIWLEVHEFNSAARSLYERLGYRQVGVRPGYYRDGAGACLYSLEP